MKIMIKKTQRFTPEYIMRRCGYGLKTTGSGQKSFVRVMGASGYPRFHAYLDEKMDKNNKITGFSINLHLDQKKPTYGKNTAHSGEYDSDIVKQEAKRLEMEIASMV